MTWKLGNLTVLLPNYNHAHFLPQCLDAILSQSLQPGEVLVIDDASTDNSIEVIQHYAAKHPAVRLACNEKNMGAAFGVSRGLKLAKGDYVYFAAADDMVLPGLFEKSISLLEQYPQAALCSGISVIVEREKRYEAPSPPYVSNAPSYLGPEEVLNSYVKKDWFIMGNTAIYRRCLLNEKTFPNELGRFNDEFTILMLSLRYGACFLPENLSIYHVRSNSYSANSELDLFAQRKLAETLMTTTHAEFFPRDYVEYFTKLNIYTEAMFQLGRIDQSSREYLDRFSSLLMTHRISKHLVLTVIRSLTFLQKIAIKVILYFQLGRFSLFRVFRFIGTMHRPVQS